MTTQPTTLRQIMRFQSAVSEQDAVRAAVVALRRRGFTTGVSVSRPDGAGAVVYHVILHVPGRRVCGSATRVTEGQWTYLVACWRGPEADPRFPGHPVASVERWFSLIAAESRDMDREMSRRRAAHTSAVAEAAELEDW